MKLEITKQELAELLTAIDHRLDDFRNSPYEVEELDRDQQLTYKHCQSVLGKLTDLNKTENSLPRLSTYTLLTGTTYEVEAYTEAEALARFFDWYGSDKQEFTDTICEEGEALTIVYDHD